MTRKHLFFIFRSAPYSTAKAQEGLDALLAATVFDQAVSVLFMGDGVFQLSNDQAPVQGKNFKKMLQSLALYDIENIFVQASALSERKLSPETLAINGRLVDEAEIHRMLSCAQHILSF